MVRSRIFALLLVGTLGAPHMNAVTGKDAAKLSVGAGLSASVWTAFQYAGEVKSCGELLEELSENKLGLIMPALIGAAVAFPFTTHGRLLRAQFNMYWVDQKLMAMAMKTYATDAALIDVFEQKYVASKYCLIMAYENLAKQFNYMESAVDLIECVLAEISDDPAQTASLKEWLADIVKMKTRVAYILNIMRNDPRWLELAKIKIKEDTVGAMKAMQYQVSLQAHYPIRR